MLYALWQAGGGSSLLHMLLFAQAKRRNCAGKLVTWGLLSVLALNVLEGHGHVCCLARFASIYAKDEETHASLLHKKTSAFFARILLSSSFISCCISHIDLITSAIPWCVCSLTFFVFSKWLLQTQPTARTCRMPHKEGVPCRYLTPASTIFEWSTLASNRVCINGISIICTKTCFASVSNTCCTLKHSHFSYLRHW